MNYGLLRLVSLRFTPCHPKLQYLKSSLQHHILIVVGCLIILDTNLNPTIKKLLFKFMFSLFIYNVEFRFKMLVNNLMFFEGYEGFHL